MSIGESIDAPILKRISEMSLFSVSIFNDDYEAHLQEGRCQKISSLRMTIESIRRTTEYASDIAEIVLNLNIEQMLEV